MFRLWIVPVIILVIVLIVFGPGKLGQLGGALGQSMREFRKAKDDGPPTAEPPKGTS
ncbi:MAG TPA: twin-arginine translocase TatA/TatE family subunit [Candidatus Dormibacteraeota bacterium]